MEFNFTVFGFLVFVTTLTIFGLSLFVEWGIVKHVMNNPAKGLIVSVFGSFLFCLIFALVMGGTNLMTIGSLVFGLIFALILSIPSYRKRSAHAISESKDYQD